MSGRRASVPRVEDFWVPRVRAGQSLGLIYLISTRVLQA